MYEVRKTYEHNIGLSCTFRQWRAESHCHFMHGYALKVVLVFRSDKLNQNNWVTDFGGLKPVKKWLEETFDHKTLVASDDPCFDLFEQMHREGIIDMVEVDHVGCEAFAQMIFENVRSIHSDAPSMLKRVEVHEHSGNMAAYEG